ncbi:hypothetical protein APHAL10511_001074 [Amanita phalloides]|nr:hypothetical protein APHAL10511_001074 [Amanita phalloides]
MGAIAKWLRRQIRNLFLFEGAAHFSCMARVIQLDNRLQATLIPHEFMQPTLTDIWRVYKQGTLGAGCCTDRHTFWKFRSLWSINRRIGSSSKNGGQPVSVAVGRLAREFTIFKLTVNMTKPGYSNLTRICRKCYLCCLCYSFVSRRNNDSYATRIAKRMARPEPREIILSGSAPRVTSALLVKILTELAGAAWIRHSSWVLLGLSSFSWQSPGYLEHAVEAFLGKVKETIVEQDDFESTRFMLHISNERSDLLTTSLDWHDLINHRRK